MIRGRSTKHTISGSHRQDFQNQWNARTISLISDLRLSLGDDAMDELEEIDHRQARMLERGTGKLRKCQKCGEVFVNPRAKEMKFGKWLNRHGFTCYFCRSGEPVSRTQKWKRKCEIMRKVWDLYVSRINIGVKVTKI